MDQKNKTVVLAVVAVIAVALVAINFDKITGKATTSSTVSMQITPPAVSSGQAVTVTVRTNGNRVKDPLQIVKVGGTEIRNCQSFKTPCSGNWCNKPIITAQCVTSPSWSGGYKVVATEYQTSKELGVEYFTVT